MEEAHLLNTTPWFGSWEGFRLDGIKFLCLTDPGVRHGLPWELECVPDCIYSLEPRSSSFQGFEGRIWFYLNGITIYTYTCTYNIYLLYTYIYTYTCMCMQLYLHTHIHTHLYLYYGCFGRNMIVSNPGLWSCEVQRLQYRKQRRGSLSQLVTTWITPRMRELRKIP